MASATAIRDGFARAALSSFDLKHDGRYTKEERQQGLPEKEADWIATAAYRYADAMMKARKVKDEG